MYHPLIFHLDLCILSYHLYHQTLVWPMDPYYEQMDSIFDLNANRRFKFMQRTRDKFHRRDKKFHGPGNAQGWPVNSEIDPIMSRYDRLNPWVPSIVNAETEWEVIYLKQITDPIRSVKMVQYDTDGTSVIVTPIEADQGADKPDLLYCFEGATGHSGDSPKTKPGGWSLMGYALAHQVPGSTAYTVHIVFRGSRSGSASRSVRKAKWGRTGNPDWVTDMGDEYEKDPGITNYGMCYRGFQRSINSMMPTIVRALQEIHKAKNSSPQTVFVSGHSLGGALASYFASAVILGNSYGPFGVGPKMPVEVRFWPWRGMQVITFSAPNLGTTPFNLHFDRNVAIRRVWGEGDPVTFNYDFKDERTEEYSKSGPRSSVGVYVKAPANTDIGAISFFYHYPHLLRMGLILWIKDLEKNRNSTGPVTIAEEHLLANVPANSGGDKDINQPWRSFKHFNDVLVHLTKIGQIQNVNQCFPNFGEHLIIYLEILYSMISKETGIQSKMESLLDKICEVDSSGAKVDPELRLGDIDTTWDIVDKLTDVPHNFIKLCIFLLGMVKDAELGNPASPAAKKHLSMYYLLEEI